MKYEKQKIKLAEKYDLEQTELKEEHRLKIMDYENMFTQVYI